MNLAGWVPSDDDVRAELMLSLHEEFPARCFPFTGAGDRAEHVYHGALSMAASKGRIRRARILRNLGKTRSIRHLHANALSAYGEAEQALGDPTDGGDSSEEAWREWVEIRNERVWAHYWMGDSTALTSLVRDLRPVVERYGNSRCRRRTSTARCAWPS